MHRLTRVTAHCRTHDHDDDEEDEHATLRARERITGIMISAVLGTSSSSMVGVATATLHRKRTTTTTTTPRTSGLPVEHVLVESAAASAPAPSSSTLSSNATAASASSSSTSSSIASTATAGSPPLHTTVATFRKRVASIASATPASSTVTLSTSTARTPHSNPPRPHRLTPRASRSSSAATTTTTTATAAASAAASAVAATRSRDLFARLMQFAPIGLFLASPLALAPYFMTRAFFRPLSSFSASSPSSTSSSASPSSVPTADTPAVHALSTSMSAPTILATVRPIRVVTAIHGIPKLLASGRAVATPSSQSSHSQSSHSTTTRLTRATHATARAASSLLSSLATSSSSSSSTSTSTSALTSPRSSESVASRAAIDVFTLREPVIGQAGDDAWFVSADRLVLGVADGVGGWSTVRGGNSAAYSLALMTAAAHACSAPSAIPSSPTRSTATTTTTTTAATTTTTAATTSRSPLLIMKAAWLRMRQRTRILGSTTVCIVAFDPISMHLSYANLGDSGFLLLRDGRVHMRCDERQHAFNTPFQLGVNSPDRPEHSVRGHVRIQPGDLLILATDGFFDNLSHDEIVEAVNQQHAQHDDDGDDKRAAPTLTTTTTATPIPSIDAATMYMHKLDELAHDLAQLAHEAARDPLRHTPFELYSRQHGRNYRGGKMDDITVLVSEFRVASMNNMSTSATSSSATSSQEEQSLQ